MLYFKKIFWGASGHSEAYMHNCTLLTSTHVHALAFRKICAAGSSDEMTVGEGMVGLYTSVAI